MKRHEIWWRLRANGREHTVAVSTTPGATGRDLVEALGGVAPGATHVDGNLIDLEAPIAEQRLPNGGFLHGDSAAPEPGSYLVAIAGEHAGQSWPVGPGTTTIGRSPDRDIVLSNHAISRHHATIAEQSRQNFTLNDHGSVHKTQLNGAPFPKLAAVRPGDLIEIADERFLLVDVVEPAPTAPSADSAALRVVSRRPRPTPTPVTTELTGPPKPNLTSVPNTPLWQSLLSALPMLAFFLISGRNVWFLPLLIIAPLAYAGIGVVRRRRAERSNEQAQASYARELDAFTATCVHTAQVLAGQQRGRQIPALAPEIHARACHQRLWERHPDDGSSLHAVFGTADRPAPLKIQGVKDPVSHVMYGVPVDVDLTLHSLGIVGAMVHARSTARHVALSLAVTNAPTELRMWFLAPDEAPGWDRFAGWLPHTSTDRAAMPRVGTTETTRAMVMGQLLALLDDRADCATAVTDVLFVDSPALVGDLDVLRLATEGPAAGLAVVICAPTAPDGTAANLFVDVEGRTARLEVLDEPAVEQIALARLSYPHAIDGAATLAGLTARDPKATQPHRATRLLELAGTPSLTADDVLSRWSAPRPAGLSALIGDSAGTPMSIDLVSHGPHAMVGGGTGSGKTELLKTLFASLVMNNSPDELSIVFVDFKGAIDFDNLRDLPHVLDLATNQDPTGFARTVTLLSAEVKRRQRCLVEAQVTNLQAYHDLWRSQPATVPPIPRLLLVIDEFAELLDSDVGRENLAELVSVARVGRALGVHLMLLTQVFDHKLPTHIDANTSLRICMRANAATSKTVLGSDLASGISKDEPGRGYVVVGEGPAVGFQTARVAGRSTGYGASDAPAAIAAFVDSPAEHLHVPTTGGGEPPFSETDLALVCDAVRRAGRAIGWQQPAIPWPAALPDRLHSPTTQPINLGSDRGIVLGLADLPDHQHQQRVSFDLGDDAMLFLGSNQRELADQLMTVAIRLAETNTPDEVHLAALSLTAEGLEQLQELPHCFGVAANDRSLALRIIRRISQEIGDRRLGLSRDPLSVAVRPRIVLFVAGFDQLAKRGSEPDPCLAPLRALIAAAPGTGVQVVIAGSPVTRDRVGVSVPKTIAFEHERRNGPDVSLDARGIDLSSGTLVQMARLAEDALHESAERSLRIQAVADAYETGGPVPIIYVPWPMPLDAAPPRTDRADAEWLTGVETESGEWAGLRRGGNGLVVPVVGRRRSGRTEALRTLAYLNRSGATTLVYDHLGRGQLLDVGDGVATTAADCEDLLRSTNGPVLLLVDDAQALEDTAPILAAVERPNTVCLIAGTNALLNGIDRTLRFDKALVLAPSGRRDASPLVSQLADEFLHGHAGRGVFVRHDEAVGIQLPSITQSHAIA